jgi:hypothetical protein
MTTIAVSCTHIAADGLGSRSGEIIALREKKLLVQEGRIYGWTGTAALFEPVLKWHRDGADPHRLPPIGADVRWSLILINSEGLFRFDYGCAYADRQHPPIAFGSGADYATGAMLAGGSARRAIEIASMRDIKTGGEIVELELAPIIGRSLVAEG